MDPLDTVVLPAGNGITQVWTSSTQYTFERGSVSGIYCVADSLSGYLPAPQGLRTAVDLKEYLYSIVSPTAVGVTTTLCTCVRTARRTPFSFLPLRGLKDPSGYAAAAPNQD